MTPEYNSMANSAIMWIACLPGVFIVFLMSFMFFKRSKKDALRIGLTKGQVSAAIRSAAATSVGPCVVMLTTILSLIMYVGAPVAWLRLNFIGSVQYELQGANFAAQGMGIELGSAAMDPNFLATATIVMCGGCVGWVIFAALFADKMDKVNAFMAGGNAELIPILGTGALVGVFSSLIWDRIYPVKNQIVAVLVSAAVMFLLTQFNKKAKLQWIREWSLTICMFTGMFAATITGSLGFLAGR